MRAGLLQTKVRGEGHNKDRALGLCGPPWPRSEARSSPIYKVIVPILTWLKWRCHLNESFYQFSEHRIRYRHRNGHLKALQGGGGFFVGTPARTAVCVASPSPLPGKPLPDDGLWLDNPDHLAHSQICLCGLPWQGGGAWQASWLTQAGQVGVMAAVSTKKPLASMPLNGHCNACTWSYVLKIGRKIHLSGTFILTL